MYCLPIASLTGPFPRFTPADVTRAPGLVYWLDYHTPPHCLLPLLRTQHQPVLLVTAHTRAAVAALIPHCPQLRIIAAPDAVLAHRAALVALLPELHGGPLVLPSRRVQEEVRDA